MLGLVKKISIAEIFGPTIQGEGPNAGKKTIFVRVAGCDYQCKWCDSCFAWKASSGKKYTQEELLSQVLKLCHKTNTSQVTLTGGNPCIYDFNDFLLGLHCNNIKVDVETQGSVFPDWLRFCDSVVISPKAPSSGMPDTIDKIVDWIENNPNVKTTIKIPVFTDEDKDFTLRYYENVKDFLNTKLYVSVGNSDVVEEGPITGRILKTYEELIDWVMNSEMDDVYILPQIHTLVWGNKQGV